MKRNFFAMMVAAIVSLFALTSCGKEPAELIVGKWTLTAMSISYDGFTMDIDPSAVGMEVTYTFNADGTGYNASIDEEESDESAFTYMVLTNGDKQILSITVEGITANYDILTLDDNNLVMSSEQTEDGQTLTTKMTFTR